MAYFTHNSVAATVKSKLMEEFVPSFDEESTYYLKNCEKLEECILPSEEDITREDMVVSTRYVTNKILTINQIRTLSTPKNICATKSFVYCSFNCKEEFLFCGIERNKFSLDV